MGFKFGLVGSIDPNISMACLVIVIGFILTFEFVTGLLEYTLEELPLYNRMMQKIYKELMQMGVMSFIIVIYEATNASGSAEEHNWILSIDFIHILLFFVAFFFVLHALYLMAVSISSSYSYVKMFHQQDSQLLIQIGNLNSLQRALFSCRYLPLSPLRVKVEFRLIYALFRDTHKSLPKAFNFTLYLKKRFEKYALKTIDVGAFSWFVIVLLGLINLARVKLHGRFNCPRATGKHIKCHNSFGYF
jgi:hypothetical protein